ncbi:MAG: PBP1A family penicillin-binding protein [Roseiflexaceae bacterium]
MPRQSATTNRRPGHLRRLLLRTVAAGAALLLVAAAYLWVSTPLPAPERLRERAALGNTRILDRNGKLLYAVPDPLSGRQRPIPLEEIPPALRQATVAIEDSSFYQNPGVDLRGILRALWTNLRSGEVVAGGSTITQQLARNFLLDPQFARQRSLERKLREAVLALKLSATLSKDEILALYLNQTYYGGLSYGVEAAARHVFGKPARDLDLAECALLAGLPQAPALYDPFASPEAARARQSLVLDAMVRQGFISAAQAETARAEQLQFSGEPAAMRAPHVVYYVIGLLDARLGPDTVARGGLTITTTIDLDLHEAAETALRRQVRLLSTPRDGGPDHRVRNGAVVVLDPHDGALLAMAGSPDFNDAASQGQVNAAVALRQPGSAIKPLTYAAALERGWTAATTILDVPTTFTTREGRPYTPQNYDRSFHGPIALREALATSSNVAAVRTLSSIGVPALLEMAERLGVASLGRDAGRYGLSLTLGGGEVTPLELTAAFGAFASGGRRVQPYVIQAVADQRPDGQGAGSIEQALAGLIGPQPAPAVLSPQIAYLISDILSDRYARMRAFGELSALDVDRPAAAKTGTTSDWRDNWTVGYTPDRVVGVWVGNADGLPMEHISGVTGAGPVWHEVMLAAHRGLPARPFARPQGVVETRICAEGGMLPSANCPAARLERFVAGTQPTSPDDTHLAVRVDPQLGCRAPEGYPPERTAVRIVRRLPAEAQPWGIAAGLPQFPQDTCAPLAGSNELPTAFQPSQNGFPENQPQASSPKTQASSLDPGIVVPSTGSVFAITPAIPRERQQVLFQARAGSGAVRVTILLDGQPLAEFERPPYRVFWTLAPGRHTLAVEARDAEGRVVRSAETAFSVEF